MKHLHGNIEPTVARHKYIYTYIYIYIDMPGKKTITDKKVTKKSSNIHAVKIIL